MTDEELDAPLARDAFPAAFQRWRVTLAPGERRPTSAAEWADTFVFVEAGALVVDCAAGGRRAFRKGDVLVLGWVPLRTLHNPGIDPVTLLAVRRRKYGERRDAATD